MPDGAFPMPDGAFPMPDGAFPVPDGRFPPSAPGPPMPAATFATDGPTDGMLPVRALVVVAIANAALPSDPESTAAANTTTASRPKTRGATSTPTTATAARTATM